MEGVVKDAVEKDGVDVSEGDLLLLEVCWDS